MLRHQFKISFFSEMKQELSTALRWVQRICDQWAPPTLYCAATTMQLTHKLWSCWTSEAQMITYWSLKSLLELYLTRCILWITWSHVILDMQICKLNFKLDQARDALYQFQRHIDEFRYRVGPSSLGFEHEAWLTRQWVMPLHDDIN